MLRAGRATAACRGPRLAAAAAERSGVDAAAAHSSRAPPLLPLFGLRRRALRLAVVAPPAVLRARRGPPLRGASFRARSGERAAEVWVKPDNVAGAQYAEVESVDLEQTVSKFKARWMLKAKMDVDPSLVKLLLVPCGARKPTPQEERTAAELDPRDTLADAGVTDGCSLLAVVAGRGASSVDANLGMRLDTPVLVPSPTSAEVFFFSERGVALQDPLRTFFLDPDLLLTTSIKDWFAHMRQLHPVSRFGGESAPTLFLSGAPKTGKTLLLKKVIPALLREDELFGVGRAAEARIWLMDTTDFDRRNGAAGFLSSLFDTLIDLAAELGLTQLDRYVKGPKPYTTVTAELKSFMRHLSDDRPTFIMLDEVQNFFLLEKVAVDSNGIERRVLDGGEILAMRSAFKALVCSSACYWVFTGSKMALFWANLALSPVNGYSLLTHIRTIRLPTSVSDSVKLHAWQVLRAECSAPELPQQLFSMSPQHHAALVFFCNEWRRMGCPPDAADFCLTTLKSKIFREIVEDYRVVLDSLPVWQRKTMLELLSDQGAFEDNIPLGVSAYLQRDLVRVSENSLFQRLESPLVRYALHALLDSDGEFVNKAVDPTSTMLSYYEAALYRTSGALLC